MKKPKTNRKPIPQPALDFAKFRDKWMRNLIMADNKEISSGAKIVGLRIALYMHQEKQWAFPSYDDLAQQTGLGVRIVQRHTFKLVEQNFLFVDRRRNAGNQYFLDAFWEKDIQNNGTVVPLSNVL